MKLWLRKPALPIFFVWSSFWGLLMFDNLNCSPLFEGCWRKYACKLGWLNSDHDRHQLVLACGTLKWANGTQYAVLIPIPLSLSYFVFLSIYTYASACKLSEYMCLYAINSYIIILWPLWIQILGRTDRCFWTRYFFPVLVWLLRQKMYIASRNNGTSFVSLH